MLPLDRATASPDHHRLVAGSSWPMWKWGIVREAGFPFEILDELSISRCSRLVDEQLEAESNSEAARLAVLEAMLSADFGDLPDQEREALIAAQCLISAGRRLGPEVATLARCLPSVRILYEEWQKAETFSCQLEKKLPEIYALELAEARGRLRRLATDDRILEAVLWQSPSAYEGIRRLASDGQPEERNKTVRQRESRAAMYIQRFCAKNDTIGFFGPRSMAIVENDDFFLRHDPGLGGKPGREVFFEHWAMVALARALARDPEIEGFLRPRRTGAIHLQGRLLILPDGQEAMLSGREARLLELCDGTNSLMDLEKALVDSDEASYPVGPDLRQAVRSMEERGLVCTTPVVPTCDLRPDLRLREELEEILRPGGTSRPLEVMDRMERARTALERSEGAAAVKLAWREMNDSFEEITGASSARAQGEVYGARSIAYLECASPRRIVLGQRFLERLRPVELVYETLRTMSVRIWEELSPQLEATFSDLEVRDGEGVDYALFVSRALPRDRLEGSRRRIEAELQSSWRAALDIRPGERRIRRSCSDLQPKLSPMFVPGRPPWPGGAFHSADLLISARDQASVERGDFEVVLGEIHAFRNMVCYPIGLCLHPEVFSAAVRAHAVDVPEVLRPNVTAEAMTRVTHFLPPHGPGVRMIDAAWPPPRIDRDRLFGERELLIRRSADRSSLVVATRDGRYESSIRVALNSYLCPIYSFRPLAGEHVPRITVDGVILARETWEVPGPPAGRGLAGFVAVRRWARKLGIPRFLFVKSPNEKKPFLVDLDNPFLVESLARVSRRSRSLRVSEMLPADDRLWLSDPEGRRRTSEIRFCAVCPAA